MYVKQYRLLVWSHLKILINSRNKFLQFFSSTFLYGLILLTFSMCFKTSVTKYKQKRPFEQENNVRIQVQDKITCMKEVMYVISCISWAGFAPFCQLHVNHPIVQDILKILTLKRTVSNLFLLSSMLYTSQV